MTADEFLQKHVDESGIDLVAGEVVRLPMNGARHGEVCGHAIGVIGEFVEANHLGRMACGHTFIRTGNDSVRCADVVFVSHSTLPKEVPTPVGAIIPPIELVVEVRSPSETVNAMLLKAVEYLNAGVRVVLLLDPEKEVACVANQEVLPYRLGREDQLTFPDILPGFAVRVREFFS